MKQRWNANAQPEFFKTLKSVGLILGFIGGIPMAAVQYGLLVPIPTIVLTICSVAGFTAFLISKFTVDSATKETLNIK